MLLQLIEQTILNYSLAELRKKISWKSFLYTWRTDKETTEAQQLIADAQQLLDKVIAEQTLAANAVYGLYPAISKGESVEVYSHSSDIIPIKNLHFFRQQEVGSSFLCLSDFVAQDKVNYTTTALPVIGCFVASAGIGVQAIEKTFLQENDPYNQLLISTLSQRLTEALSAALEDKIGEYFPNVKVIRPAVGYSSLADHSGKKDIFDLLQPEKKIGVSLTENFAMIPEQSVAGYYFFGDSAKYFNIKSVGQDQLQVYASKKGKTIEEINAWTTFLD